MQIIKSKPSEIIIYLAIAIQAFAFAATETFAQNEDSQQGRLISVTTIKVKPGKWMEFREMIKNEFKPAWAKGGGTELSVWEVEVGEGFQLVMTSPLPDFAAIDKPTPLIRGLGDDAPEFFGRASAMLDGFSSQIIKTQPQMSYQSKMSGPPKIAVVIHLVLNEDKGEVFQKFITRDYLPIVSKSGTDGFWFSKVLFGGDPSEYIALELWQNFAELDKGNPVRRVLKPDEAMKFGEKVPKGMVKDFRVDIARYLPDLSITPAATASK